MWTVEYKPGWYISGYFDRDECTYSKADANGFGVYGFYKASSVLGAKRAITQAIKKG